MAVASAMFIAGCAGGPETEPMPNWNDKAAGAAEWMDGGNGQLPAPEIVSERRAEITRALEAAEFVANETGNERAKELVEFAKAKGLPSVLTNLGPIALDGATKDLDEFYFVSLNDNDKGITPIADDYLLAPVNGVYVGDLETLFMYERGDFSKGWLGILALHELNHAENGLDGGPENPNEEATTRSFHHRLASELFEDTYDTQLKDTIEKMRPQFEAFITNKAALTLPKINTAPLEDNSSEQERRWIYATLMFDSIFHLIDERQQPMPPQNVLDAEHQKIYESLSEQLVR